METERSISAGCFDGSCPLCRAETGYYHRGDHSSALCFAGVSKPDVLVSAGLTRRRAVERFHARTGEGALHSGGAAFIEVWTRLLRWLLFLPARPTLALIFWKAKTFERQALTFQSV